jgi:hypothetical protein
MRLRDWQSRLHECVTQAWGKPFAWGTHDCCTFTCDVVVAVTGKDPMEGIRTYSNERGAKRMMDGYGGLVKMCAARLGEEIPPALAQAGDVGYVMEGRTPALASNVGGGVWMSTGPDGLVKVDPAGVLRAWRCERA